MSLGSEGGGCHKRDSTVRLPLSSREEVDIALALAPVLAGDAGENKASFLRPVYAFHAQ